MNGATFDALFRQLSARLDEVPSVKPLGADRVAASAVRALPELFAARSSGRARDRGCFDGHAIALERTLRAMPEGERAFAPVTVFEVAGADYCVDGHHRLAVYVKVLGPDALVPVERIGGTLGDAVARSVAANNVTFLPMRLTERQEAAWKLVKIGQGSKREQAALSGMSESFVAKLRRLRRCLEKSHPEGSWGSLWEAEKLSRGEGAEEDWTEDKSDAEIAEYEHRLRKAFGSKTHRRLPAIVAAMANIVGPNVLWEAIREVHQSEHEGEREDLDEDCPF